MNTPPACRPGCSRSPASPTSTARTNTASPMRVHINRDKASDLNVNVASIATALRTMVGGDDQATTYREGDDRYDVQLRVDERFRNSPAALDRLFVPSATLGNVPISNVARWKRRAARRRSSATTGSGKFCSPATLLAGNRSATYSTYWTRKWRRCTCRLSTEPGLSARVRNSAVRRQTTYSLSCCR